MGGARKVAMPETKEKRWETRGGVPRPMIPLDQKDGKSDRTEHGSFAGKNVGFARYSPSTT